MNYLFLEYIYFLVIYIIYVLNIIPSFIQINVDNFSKLILGEIKINYRND